MDIPYAPPPPFFFFFVNQKQCHFHLRLRVKIAIMLWTCSSSSLRQPSFNSCIASQIQVFFLPVWARNHAGAPYFQLTTDHESAASVWLPLCIAPQSEWPPRVHPDLLITCFEWCWNVFWPLFLSKHMWNTWESFTDGAGGGGGGGGRAVQGRICRGLKTPVTYYHYRLWSVSSLVSFVISFLLW